MDAEAKNNLMLSNLAHRRELLEYVKACRNSAVEAKNSTSALNIENGMQLSQSSTGAVSKKRGA